MFQLGQQNRVVSHWEADSIKVRFGYRKPSSFSILDIELDAVEFDLKWSDWDAQRRDIFLELFDLQEEGGKLSVPELLERMDAPARDDWAARLTALKSSISSADIQPVLGFIADHIVTVDGLIDGAGKPVKAWADVDEAGRAEIFGALNPHEIAALYGEIKRSVMLTVDEKKP